MRITSILRLLLIGFFFPLSSIAQTFTISGAVKDDKSSEPLTNVVLILTPAGDTSKPQYGISDLDGLFNIPNVAPGSYNLKTNYIGYATTNRPITVSSANLALGNIGLTRGTNTLNEVTITAEQVRAQQSGDTSSFAASSYKTNPDATAEELVTKMPGVTSENGTLKVNGEQVQKVLVDGKEFFGDDPNNAMKNLPAEIIDKIQIFDKASEQAQFTGFDDGNTQKTINIITKRGKANGTFGKVSAGYGMDDQTKDSRYTVGGNINFFNGDRRVSIVGLANNVNQQNFSSEDLLGVSSASSGRGGGGFGGPGGGRGRGGGGAGSGGSGNFGGGDAASNFLVSQQGGITKTQSAGINYTDQWGPKLKVTGSYFFNRGDNDNSTTLTRNYIVTNPDSGLTYRENGINSSINYNHRANARLEWTIDSMNSLIIQPRLSFQDNTTERNLFGQTTLGANTDQSSINNVYSAHNSGYTFNNNLTYRHRFIKPGRTVSLNIGTSLNDKTGDGLLYSQNRFGSADTTTLDQHFDLNANGLTLSGNLSYTEPLSKTSQLLLTYSPSYSKNVSDRETFNHDGVGYTDLDTGLSNKYNNNYNYQRGGLGYRYNDQKFNFNATLNAQYATLKGDQTFPYSVEVNRNFKDLLPNAMLNYRFTRTENIRVMYRTNTNAPSISQLQNIVDNSNPLLLRTGNPDLRQDYTHSLIVRYGKTGGTKGTGLFVFANASYVNNYIGNSTIIATSDTLVRGVLLARGSQLSLPVNLDGNWSARSFITYSLPAKSIKTNFNLNAGFNYSRTPAIINNLNNFADNYTINGGIVAGSNISEDIDFTLSTNGAYNIVKNTLQSQNNYNYYSQTSSLRLNWIIAKSFVFHTDLNHTLYSGLGSPYDQAYLLWNAWLGYKFLKNNAAQVDLYAFDLLRQNRAISRTITDTYIEDAATQVLQRYFMLRFTYTLRSFKSGGMPEQQGPREGEGGPGRWRGRGGEGGGRID
jgi:hypothetical protein